MTPILRHLVYEDNDKKTKMQDKVNDTERVDT